MIHIIYVKDILHKELELCLRSKGYMLGIRAIFKQTKQNFNWLLKENLLGFEKVTSSRVSTIFHYNVWHPTKNYKAAYENRSS